MTKTAQSTFKQLKNTARDWALLNYLKIRIHAAYIKIKFQRLKNKVLLFLF